MQMSNQVVPSVQKGGLTKCVIERVGWFKISMYYRNMRVSHLHLQSFLTLRDVTQGLNHFKSPYLLTLKRQYNLR